jgi:hypothetical protein
MTNTARFRPLLLLAMLVALLSSGAVAKSSSEKRMLRTAAVSSPSHGRRELFSFSWLAGKFRADFTTSNLGHEIN